MPSQVSYRLDAADPAAHLFRVEMRIARPAPDGQLVRLPAWIPGSYMIRDFARHIVSIEASAGRQPVKLAKLDSHSWRADAVDGELVLRYEVYAFDLSVRGAWLDTRRGFCNGSSVFLEAVGLSGLPHDVEFRPPQGKTHADWRLATTLPAAGAKPWRFGRYRAPDYATLLDHPVEMGTFQRVRFDARGVRHDIVVAGRHRGDLDRLARDVQKICEWQIDLFGGTPPFDRYQFQLLVGDDLYGGLEHRDSTALMASRDSLPQADDKNISDAYLGLLGLFSHEYFHAWNVKRIKPAAFSPYDLSRPNHTRLLWAFEGITSYYDDLALLRAGLITPERYLGLLAQTLTAVQRGNGRTRQTLADSSFDAWTKYYKQDENSPNAIVSYYQKGALAALALDLAIRRDTRGGKSLDDVMRALWRRWQETGAGIGEEEWEQIAGDASGLDLGGLFDRMIRSTADLPLAELLDSTGIRLDWRAATSASDRGGAPASDSPPASERIVLGVRSLADPLGVKLSHVFDHGPAQAAGLSAGDIIVALDRLRVRDLDKQLAHYRPGDRIKLHVLRRDELLTIKLKLAAAPEDTAWLTPTRHAGKHDWPGGTLRGKKPRA